MDPDVIIPNCLMSTKDRELLTDLVLLEVRESRRNPWNGLIISVFYYSRLSEKGGDVQNSECRET